MQMHRRASQIFQKQELLCHLYIHIYCVTLLELLGLIVDLHGKKLDIKRTFVTFPSVTEESFSFCELEP